MTRHIDKWFYDQDQWFIDGKKTVKKALYSQPINYEQAKAILSAVNTDLMDEQELQMLRHSED